MLYKNATLLELNGQTKITSYQDKRIIILGEVIVVAQVLLPCLGNYIIVVIDMPTGTTRSSPLPSAGYLVQVSTYTSSVVYTQSLHSCTPTQPIYYPCYNTQHQCVWLSGGVSLTSWYHAHSGAGHQNSSGTIPDRTKHNSACSSKSFRVTPVVMTMCPALQSDI